MTTNNNKMIMVDASSARGLAAYLVSQGLAPQELEKRTHISLEELEKPDQRLTIQNYNLLWDIALEYTGNPALGLVLGEQLKEEHMSVISHIFFNSGTLRQALEQLSRLFQLINEGMRADFEMDEKFAWLKYTWEDARHYSVPNMERTMSASVNRARVYLDSPLKLEYVSFQHPRPDYHEEYSRIFQCPLKFNDTCCSLVFEKHFLDYELPKSNPYLRQILLRHVEPLLNKIRARKSITIQVRNLIEKRLSKDGFDAERLAQKLGMSRHTLYRRLKAEGHSFQELIEDVRKKQAMKYLDEQRYSLSEIAFLLGFSELSAFSRAFKRWTGKSPARYNKA
ncbi:MAG: AraC family transcriptional regulator [Proteobacteria bacterium]|nr:MAG: AraC family transcriptional regulator [Pseudomonadota bacterium]